ncbi:50S ribosomal protein L11 methyltransferase [Pelovirga terrestris]|uniref:Ribosomal protein L11 methyltransferase n=1 Tax=Pelovirga terrestris TaxID=2771352 RepID=A0A8J6QX49_9BACT|nr:50S ribosomal protein L11 methyltransferase [Pelovirga terrestris]MBD1400536.1 50S ribosomal protein L11 methyltransferase [Pelovirga terrestris]
MKENYLSIDVKLKGVLVEVACAVLMEQQCCGILIEDRQLDTFEVPDNPLDLDKDYTLTAYFALEVPAALLLQQLWSAFAALPVFTPGTLSLTASQSLPQVDWAQSWKQHFTGFQVGNRLIVHPSWEAPYVEKNQVAIEIDPGMAFGTGTHATTRLCLDAIAEQLEGHQRPLRLLDVGTGSGILAIGAAALGCDRVVATDIDPVACEVARENVVRNNLTGRITVTSDPLEKIDGHYDLVVANILAEENIRLKKALLQHVRPGGWLILSGILKEKESLVTAAFTGTELNVLPPRYREDWVCLVYQRQQVV